MPLLTVNIAAKTFDEITRLVGKGLYSGMDQFIEVAALNQLALERGVSPEELKQKGHREPPTSSMAGRAPAPTRAPTGNGREKSRAPLAQRKATSSTVPESDVATLKEHTGLDHWNGDGPAAMAAKSRPEGEHLWGQVNRVFAMKFVARWLAVMTSGERAWPRIEVTAPGITFDAAVLGSVLDADDLAQRRKRDELFGTGLPRRGNLASFDRFQSQYIARTTRSGEIYPGAICHYALADFDGDQLGLTSQGFELARLQNPILDTGWKSATSTLSPDERALFLSLIRQFVPGEKQDFEVVLGAVAAGNNTPEDLLATVRGVLPERWSDVMARTHVSGVVARLSELGLLQRQWEGRNVLYAPTATASAFLNGSVEEVRDAR